MIQLNNFKKFDPLNDSPLDIPNCEGNYIIVLKPNKKLPEIGKNYTCKTIDNKKIIYTGISNKSLRCRDYKQHFNGNAGNSTLRKSIGSLFGWKKIPRDQINNGKTKFNTEDEDRLSKWMKQNLDLYFLANPTPKEKEVELINQLNPPLNLSKNKNNENAEFRAELSRLRKIK
ncbi:GIY-YIG nuclease family protein [Marinifilum flexuosum]|uniref:GIY-YIG nuclease family protein n=1 Tax=Marinifilum flexuosum TaxID=1117708 RepID=UPI002493FBC0|nr:hypothetical protein [Marinifilum flexuosum]